MVTVKKNQPATAIQQTQKRRSEVVEGEISITESFCSTCNFLTHGGNLDTFVILKASTQKEQHAVVAEASLVASSFSVVSLVRM